MNYKSKLKKKILSLLGVVKYDGPVVEEKNTFINDPAKVLIRRIREYNVWYNGEEGELLNFYSVNNVINYNYEPMYDRAKRSYFWSIISTENDVKITHSGQPRNIIDTITNIIRFPVIKADTNQGIMPEDMCNVVNKNLQSIIKHTNIKSIYKNQQMPLTLVEGWGCYKINWDKDLSDYPIISYYRAENVDFIKQMGILVGVVFKDYYTDGITKYLVQEIRHLKYDDELQKRVLVIEKHAFMMTDTGDPDFSQEISLNTIPGLSEKEKYIELGPLNILLCVPSIFFEDTSSSGAPGRSIFTGKISLFDDLDQALSQSSNAVRKSTPVEYFNTEYAERDPKTGMPKQPHSYDRSYVMMAGARNADGTSTGQAVQTTQPNIDFSKYSAEAIQILMQIISGLLSPATIGIDIAKKDNAEAQREKEKVTIFTRNALIDVETEILKNLMSQCLCALEYIQKGEITVQEYDISIKFSEFADDSYENKLKTLGDALDSQTISEDMYMQRLYGDSLSDKEYKRELEWLKEHHTKPRDEGMKGLAGGGQNTPGILMGDDDE